MRCRSERRWKSSTTPMTRVGRLVVGALPERVSERVLPPERLRGGLVDEHRGRVGRPRRVEVAAGHDVDVHDVDEVLVDVDGGERDALVRSVVGKVGEGVVLVVEEPARGADLDDAGEPAQLLLERALLAVERLPSLDGDDMLFVEAEALVLDVVELAPHDERPGDHRDRDGKLDDHEPPSQPPARPAGAGAAGTLQRLGRLEVRQHERGVAARAEPHEHGAQQRGRPEGPAEEGVQRQLGPRQRVEGRQRGRGQEQGGHEGHAGHEHGLAQKLPHELPALRPEGLADPDLTGPLGGARRDQVREVDARDQQDEERDGGERPDVRDAPDRLHLVLQVGVEIDLRQALGHVAPLVAAQPPVGRHAERLGGLRPDVCLHEPLQRLGEGGPLVALVEPNVGVKAVGHPRPPQQRRHLEGRQQVKVEVRGRRHVGHHPRHAAGAPVHPQRLAEHVGAPEVPLGRRPGQDHGVRVGEHRAGIAPQEVEAPEDAEEGRVGGVDAILREAPVADLHAHLRLALQAHDRLDRRHVAPQRVGHRCGRDRRREAAPGQLHVERDAVDALGFGVKGVVAELLLDPEPNQQAGREAHREAEHVDGRDAGPALERPGCDRQVVAEHGRCLGSVGMGDELRDAVPFDPPRGRAAAARPGAW